MRQWTGNSGSRPKPASVGVQLAPDRWAEHCWHTENKLHQLSPYIGKLKSSIAEDVVGEHSREGDTVLDPFCGSGTIPLVAAMGGRSVVASDSSLYSFVLTKAKLSPPKTVNGALSRVTRRFEASQNRNCPDLRSVPKWVRAFFHPGTLRDAIRFADECAERKDYFLLACFLGILHHQRPGFLSYPSSHLVPYLREKNFPREKHPELYGKRDLLPRMEKKVCRALSRASGFHGIYSMGRTVLHRHISNLRLPRRSVNTIITSPPYMNALDYVRDNRLRMWFLDRSTQDYSPEGTDTRESFGDLVSNLAQLSQSSLRRGGKCVIIVGETVRRKRMEGHPADWVLQGMAREAPSLELLEILEDSIPDVRRSRRSGSATKKEMFLVFRRR